MLQQRVKKARFFHCIFGEYAEMKQPENDAMDCNLLLNMNAPISHSAEIRTI